MKQHHPKQSGVTSGILLLLPCLLVGSDLTGRAAGAPSDGSARIFSSSRRTVEAAAPAGDLGPTVTAGAESADGPAAQDQSQRDPAGLRGDGAGRGDRGRALQDARPQPSSAAAPDVDVRVGVHGDFERVVFEWPEPIEYDVVQNAQEVVISFARAAKIDLSKLRDGFGGRMVEARADGGDSTRRVVLRVLPDVTIRSFLENDRVVVIDLLGEPAPRRVASLAPQPEPRATAGAIEQNAARTDLPAIGTDALFEADHPRVQPTGDAAPDVDVRVGDHGDYERVVFEWPEGIEYDVAQHEDEVSVTFSRAGRIDFSRVRDRLGRRMLEARTVGADATRRVLLRVVPDASIRSFSLEDDRIVVVDVLGGSASRTVASPVPRPERRPAESAVQERESPAEPSKVVSHALSQATDAPPSSVPSVAVRVGEHGAFERVVFEWPETIGHEVVQRADRVTVAFSRPGRIDLSRVGDRFGGRVVEAWADSSDATSQVVLRVSPDANIRSFSLENDRVVVVDVFEEPTPQHLAQHAPDPAPDPIRELRRELEQRDAVIDSLLARVEQLERDQVLSSGDLDRVVAGQAGTTLSAGDPSLPRPGAQAVATTEQPPGTQAPEQKSAASDEGQDSNHTTAQAQPGQFEVDEEEIDRALERTLVQTGVLLLPMGQAEVEPFFSYTRRESDSSMVVFADNGLSVGAEVDVRRNEFVSGQTLRFGMPFDSQVEFGFPYRFVDQSMVATVDAGGSEEVDHFGHGMGDMSIGFAKTLVRENGHWWPDLVGRVTWDTDTGKTSSNDVALGGGFNELRGSLSAVKRQDPLAFVGGFSYETTFEKDDVKPGDEFGFSIGTVLAASPATSLRLALDQRFIDNAKTDGEGINGSDFVIGTATLGASVVLGRGLLLDVAADIGLTDDAPDYAARASLPIRFNLPVY